MDTSPSAPSTIPWWRNGEWWSKYWLLVLLAVSFAVFIWPTPYVHVVRPDGSLYKINRFTGHRINVSR